jgi:hypothetical protein
VGKKERSPKTQKESRAGLAGRIPQPTPSESAPLTEETPQPDESLPEDVLEAIAELGGACSEISISRRDARRKYAYLDRVPADEFSLDWLKDTYGGGEYLARFIDSAKQFRGSKTFTIDGPSKQPPVAGADDRRSELREVLQSVRELVDSQREAQAKETTTLLSEMVKEARADAEEARRENRELLMKLIEVRGKGRGDESRTLKLYDRMFEVLDRVAESKTEIMEENAHLRAQLAEAPGGLIDPVTGRVMEKLLDAIRPLRAVAPAPGVQSGARAEPGTAEAESSAEPAPGRPTWTALFQHYIADMVKLAQDDRDPALYADLLVDQLPREAVSVLYTAISDHGGPDGFLEVLSRTWPAVAQHREWFSEYLRALHEALREESVEKHAGDEPQPAIAQRRNDA